MIVSILSILFFLSTVNYLRSTTYQCLYTDHIGPVYAYGWTDFLKDGRRYSYHVGSAGTFLTEVTIDKSKSIAYIVMMNTDSPAARKMAVTLRTKMEDMYANL